MQKDRLYLLKPDFHADGLRQFCSECAMVEGMLSFYPKIRAGLDVKYIGFTRPRPEIVAELGPDNQSSPVLVLGNPAHAQRVPPNVHVKSYQGRLFINDPYEVCEYLAAVHGTGHPRK